MRNEGTKHTRIPQSRIVYKIIAWTLGNPMRRVTTNPFKVLTRMGVGKGITVLEVGCGPGFFTIPAAQLTLDGTVYALDISYLMTETVERKAKKHGVENIRTIVSSANNTGLDDESIDLIFCIDVLSDITDIATTFQEMHRILKPGGILSVYEPHSGWEPGAWKPERSIKELTTTGLFVLHDRDAKIIKFRRLPN